MKNPMTPAGIEPATFRFVAQQLNPLCYSGPHNEAVYQLFIDFKKAYGSVRRQVWYNILIEFGNPLKLVGGNRNVSD